MKTAFRPAIAVCLAMLMLAACNRQQQRADQLLSEAHTAMDAADYDRALQLVTQLRQQCPRAVEQRREALVLWQETSLHRTQAELARTDSMLLHATAAYDSTTRQLPQVPALTAHQRTTLRHRLDSLRQRRDSLKILFDTQGATIRYIHRKQKATTASGT